jgi:hypothetical protein
VLLEHTIVKFETAEKLMKKALENDYQALKELNRAADDLRCALIHHGRAGINVGSLIMN